jgi:hypothetical protein
MFLSSRAAAPQLVRVDAPAAVLLSRDALWENARNSLGIARLLVHEGRPDPLVGTACHTAVEMACRTALEQASCPFDGDLEAAFDRLSVPEHVFERLEKGSATERLAAAEKVVAWVASYLRSEAPERNWGF